MEKATIFNIQRFSIHDGPGIRTTVFFKGCPLHCLWCANPESQDPKPELEVIPINCIGCGYCIKACPTGALYFDDSGIHVNRELCQRCGRCAQECYSRTLKYVGKEMTVDEVVAEIMKDEVFFKNSGGGITFSGGEPLMHAQFVLEVLKKIDGIENCTTAIETCGYGNTELFTEIAGYLDLVFFDVKHSDSKTHRELTGVSNELILKNLRSIQKTAKRVVVRTPVIPGMNDDPDNIRHTAMLCTEMESVNEWELLPFHNLGEGKYDSIGKSYDKSMFSKPSSEHMDELAKIANEIMKPAGKQCKVENSGMAK